MTLWTSHMEIENKSTELEAKNQAETETPTKDATQSSGDAGTGSTGVDGVKSEESAYAKELRELKEKDARSAEIIEKKEATIQALKKKNVAKSDDTDDIETRVLATVRAENQAKEVAQKVTVLTRDPDEQKLILHHLNNSVVRTGDIDRDLQNAMAIANTNIIMEQKRNLAIEERREDFLTSFPANNARGNQPMQTTDPMQRQVEALVQKMNPDAVKHVKPLFQG